MPFDPVRAACRYKQADDMISREIAGEILLVPIRNNVGDLEGIYTLNETGAFIWSKLNGTNTLGDIHNAMVKEFEISSDTAWDDLLEFMSDLAGIQAYVEVQ